MLKRAFDVLASAMGLVVLAPFFLLIAFMIKLDSPGPIFFRQERVGRYGVPFSFHKFRTMRVGAEKEGLRITVCGDARITRTGEFLRQRKLDELPQLIDVLAGDMSFVGPRPEVPEYVACYPADVRDKVLSIRPGITDPASIVFNAESEILGQSDDPHKVYVQEILPKKLRYYSDYVDKQHFFYDLAVIFKTLAVVFKR